MQSRSFFPFCVCERAAFTSRNGVQVDLCPKPVLLLARIQCLGIGRSSLQPLARFWLLPAVGMGLPPVAYYFKPRSLRLYAPSIEIEAWTLMAYKETNTILREPAFEFSTLAHKTDRGSVQAKVYHLSCTRCSPVFAVLNVSAHKWSQG